jgi:hypothetical protein
VPPAQVDRGMDTPGYPIVVYSIPWAGLEYMLAFENLEYNPIVLYTLFEDL